MSIDLFDHGTSLTCTFVEYDGFEPKFLYITGDHFTCTFIMPMNDEDLAGGRAICNRQHCCLDCSGFCFNVVDVISRKRNEHLPCHVVQVSVDVVAIVIETVGEV